MSNDERAQAEEVFQWSLVNAPRPARPVFKPGDDGYGPEYCGNSECEDLMPESRRRDGQTLCTSCKSTQEQREKRRY